MSEGLLLFQAAASFIFFIMVCVTISRIGEIRDHARHQSKLLEQLVKNTAPPPAASTPPPTASLGYEAAKSEGGGATAVVVLLVIVFIILLGCVLAAKR
jgi:hypothetical protein